MEFSKVADVKTGYGCNNNCRHCVIAEKRCLRDRSTKEYKKELEEARKNAGMVIITGGEPTIREDIFELVSYAKNLNFKKIFMQTNGRMFSYTKFAEKMTKTAKINYVIAIHAHKSEIHDYITQVPGSFGQTIKGIKNLIELNQHVSGKLVISKPNYRLLPETTKFLIKLRVSSINFSFLNPRGNAQKYFDDVVPKISNVASYVRNSIDICKKQKKTRFHAVEGIPFCLMKGYEEYIAELSMFPKEVRDLDFIEPDGLKNRRITSKSKGPQCVKCKYNSICEGTWKDYTKRYGFAELRPL